MPSRGRRIGGRFLLEELLGRGAGGEVWQARDDQTADAVALKLLRTELARDSRMRSRFAREARAVAAVTSPFVCRLIDAGIDEVAERPYLVFELVAGEPLDKLLKRKRALSLDEIGPVVADMLAGLAATHRAGIVHRDVKPSNVIVTRSQAGASGARILDFGVAKILESGEEQTLTSQGALVGTLAYMAPERLRGTLRVSASCDLYAVATIVFRALTGRLPFPARDAVALIATKQEFAAPTLHEASPGVAWPEGLERFVVRGLARSPAKRFSSAEAMLDGWREALRMGVEANACDETGAVGSSDGSDDADQWDEDTTTFNRGST